MNRLAIARTVCRAGRRLAERGLIAGTDGNIAARCGADRVLVTPAGRDKGELEPGDLVEVDLAGRVVRGPAGPSSELDMHLVIFAQRPDVAAVVHAHPPTAVALTLAGIDLSQAEMPEAVTALGGGVPTAPYATPSTADLAEGVARTVVSHDACLMARHGAVAVGRDVFEALDRMETVERVAQVILRARLLGANPTPLPKAEIDRLLQISGRR